MQWLLEHIHVWSGTPWWASIILATVFIRTIQIPGYLRLSDVGARMREINPYAQPILERYKKAATARDLVTMHQTKAELNGIYKKSGVNKIWFFWPLAQLPIFYGFYNLLFSMVQIPVPGLLDGGVLWFQNLAVADPLVVLPLVSAGSIAMTLAVYEFPPNSKFMSSGFVNGREYTVWRGHRKHNHFSLNPQRVDDIYAPSFLVLSLQVACCMSPPPILTLTLKLTTPLGLDYLLRHLLRLRTLPKLCFP